MRRTPLNYAQSPVIPADTLDNVLAGLSDRWKDDVAVIWIDVQGYEGCFFAGAHQILDRGVPVVSEVWPYGIVRAGMTLDTFNALLTEIWRSFWVKRRGRSVRYHILSFRAFLDELVPNEEHDNVIFTRE